jgi:hypothetical protein
MRMDCDRQRIGFRAVTRIGPGARENAPEGVLTMIYASAIETIGGSPLAGC